MNLRNFFCIFLLFGGIMAVAQETPAEKSVKALSLRKNTWLIKGQADSLTALLDKRCEYIHSNGWIQSATDVVNDLKSGKMVYNKISVENIKARQYEKMVVVTGKGKFEGVVNSMPFTFDLVFTEVFLNRASGWKLVTRHSSRLP